MSSRYTNVTLTGRVTDIIKSTVSSNGSRRVTKMLA